MNHRIKQPEWKYVKEKEETLPAAFKSKSTSSVWIFNYLPHLCSIVVEFREEEPPFFVALIGHYFAIHRHQK